MTTYSNYLKLRKPAIGQTSWGDELHDNIDILDFFHGGAKAGNVVLSGCAPSDGGGLDVDYAGGEVSVNGTRHTIASGSKTCTANVMNYLCVDSAGVVQIYTTAPTADYAAIAMIDAGAATLDRIADARKLAEGAAAFDLTYDPDNYEPDSGESKEIEQHLAGIDAQLGLMSGFKNLLINGGFSIDQRGTSFTGLGNGDRQYTLDRWEFIETGTVTGEIDVSQSTDHPFDGGHSLKIETATAQTSFAAADDMRIVQHIEGQFAQHLRFGNAAAKAITVSFWVKSNVTGTHSLVVWQPCPTTSRGAIGEFTISAADTWERKSFTLPGDTAGQIDNDNGIGLQFIFSVGGGTDRQSATVGSWAAPTNFFTRSQNSQNLLASTANYINFAEIQLEVGEVATPFENRDFAGFELALCKRYYQVSSHGTSNTFTVNASTAGAKYYSGCAFAVPMRATPSTITILTIVEAGTGFNTIAVGDVGISIYDSGGFRWDVTAINTSINPSRVGVSYAADAEL